MTEEKKPETTIYSVVGEGVDLSKITLIIDKEGKRYAVNLGRIVDSAVTAEALSNAKKEESDGNEANEAEVN